MGAEKPVGEGGVHKSQAGLVVTFTSSFFDQSVQDFVEIFEQSFEGLNIPKEACTTTTFDSTIESISGNLCLNSPSFKIQWKDKEIDG